MIVLMFDMMDPQGLQHMNSIIEELMEAQYDGRRSLILLGNKSDSPNRVIGAQMIRDFVKRQPYDIEFFDISARTGLNVNESFQKAIS